MRSEAVSGRSGGCSGNLRAVGSPRIDDRRLLRGRGRAKTVDAAECPVVTKEYGAPVALAVFEADGDEVAELAGDERESVVPGGPQGRRFEASAGAG